MLEYGTNNGKIMGLIPSKIDMHELINIYVFKAAYIASKKSFC